VILDDPQDILRRDAIEKSLKAKFVKYDVALKEDIIKFIDLFFQADAEEASFTDLLGKMEAGEGAQEAENEEAVDESDSAIIQLVNKIISDAFNRRASDIHIEPNVIDKNVLVRFRIDGDCTLYQTVPYSYRAALLSRIKIMANLDITVKRLPQDGKIKIRKSGGEEIELRVVTIPTQGGVEDVVMRILAKGGALPLSAMSMTPKNHQDLLKICETALWNDFGALGPTGSGKNNNPSMRF